MDIAVGDTIQTRKKHPCGASSFEVLRVGMDFKIAARAAAVRSCCPARKLKKTSKKCSSPRAAAQRTGNHWVDVRRTAQYVKYCFPEWRLSAAALRNFPSA